MESIVHPQVKIYRRAFKFSREAALALASGLMTIPAPKESSIPRSRFAVAVAGGCLAFAKHVDLTVDAQSAGKFHPSMKKTQHIAPAIIFTLYSAMWIMGMFDADPPPLPSPKEDVLFVAHLTAILGSYVIAAALATRYTPPENNHLSTSVLNTLRFYFCRAPYVFDFAWLAIQGTRSFSQLESYSLQFVEMVALGMAMGASAYGTAAETTNPRQISPHALMQTVYQGFAIAVQNKLAHS